MTNKPEWLSARSFECSNRERVEGILRGLSLNTVCHEACCPNYGVCFSRKAATFLIMGNTCTRNCSFCGISPGSAQPLDPDEPYNIALAAKELDLRYVTITSVTRDDLPDGGAFHFAKAVRLIGTAARQTLVEVLVPDFQGNHSALETVTGAYPAVIAHNMETVEPLYGTVRPQASYWRSLELLRKIKLLSPKAVTKSGIMVGLGENREQVFKLFGDLREAGCDFLTVGQYLCPSARHFPVKEFVAPATFAEYKAAAEKMGFLHVAFAPLVRSSFAAEEAYRSLFE